MIQLYKTILQLVPDLVVPDLEDLLPTNRKNRSIEVLCVELRNFETVTKTLQKEDLTLSDARVSFSAVFELYYSLRSRLGKMPKLYINLTSRPTVATVQDGRLVEI